MRTEKRNQFQRAAHYAPANSRRSIKLFRPARFLAVSSPHTHTRAIYAQKWGKGDLRPIISIRRANIRHAFRVVDPFRLVALARARARAHACAIRPRDAITRVLGSA